MYIKHMGSAKFMCIVRSGVLQGCPLASLLFVIAMEPFLILFKLSIEDAALGVIRACADDIAVTLKNMSSLVQLFDIFQIAEQVAGLRLKVTKCFLIPLSAPLSPELVQTVYSFLCKYIPAWSDFKIVATAEYLGIWLGPAASTRNWVPQISKLLDRTNIIHASAPPTALAVGTYNVKALTVLSYPAQFIPPPLI